MFLSKSYFLGLLFFTTAAFSHHGQTHSESLSGNVVLFSTVSVWLESFLLGREDRRRVSQKAREAMLARLNSQTDRSGEKYVF